MLKQNTSPFNAKPIALLAGGFSLALGLIVLVGWHTDNPSLIKLHPSFIGMLYNTALCFTVSGIGFLAIAFRLPFVVGVSGIFVALFGFLVFIQYVFGIDLKIDEFFIKDTVSQHVNYPGRMAPNTAINFVFTGIMLFIMRKREASNVFRFVRGCLASLISAFGIVAVVGYIINYKVVYTWGSFAGMGMAFNTAAGFVVIGFSSIIFVWKEGRIEENVLPRWLPVGVGLGIIAVTISLWQALVLQEHIHVETLVKAKGLDITNHIKDGLESRIQSLVRMANRFGAYQSISQKEWEADARLYMEHFAGLQAIIVTDKELYTRRSVPLNKNEAALRRYLALRKRELSGNSHEMFFSNMINVSQGVDGFIATVPIVHKNELAGFVVSLFNNKEFLDSILVNDIARGYSVAIFQGYDELYRFGGYGDIETGLNQEAEIHLYGNTWRVKILPKQEYLSQALTPLPKTTLFAGGILACIVVFAVYYAQTARQRAREIAKTNEQLNIEILERKGVEEELEKHRNRLEELIESRTVELKELNKQLEWEVKVRKEAESAIEKHALDLERSNAELEQFAYVASHDLQEPLRIVAGYVQLLAKRYKGKLDKDADEFIGYAVDGANRMQALIKDLLAYSRLGGAQNKEFVPVDCEHIFNRTVSSLKAAIEDRNSIVTHDTLPKVVANETQLEEVFMNLVGNAIKYNRETRPWVHVSAMKKENEWLFSVRDNGIGIDPKYRDRIFVIFQRLHGKTEYSGTGIGLAICKKVIENHGGRIWVESEQEKGSAFYFTIPDRGKNDYFKEQLGGNSDGGG